MAISYKKLFKLLIDRELKSVDLSNMSGVSQPTISAMKSGSRVSASTIEKICDALGCDASDIMETIADPPCEEASSEIEVYSKMGEIATGPQWDILGGPDSELGRKLAEHRTWLQTIRHERPNPQKPFKVGVYIRYFNQTKYENYLEYHIKQYLDTLNLCPRWELVDIYIDEGATAPNMESAKEWCRLLDDCMDGKVDLIITQKVSNVSKKPAEVTFCARILAAQTPPIGIYFISEDMFTLASYYMEDLHDDAFLPTPEWQLLPDDESERGMLHD